MYSEPRTLPGTRFLTIFLKCEMKIIFVVGVFILDNLIEWTLIHIVCWYTCYGGVANERTWTLCKNSLGNQCIFRAQLRKIIQNPHFGSFFDRFLIVFWFNFDQSFIKTDGSHWKTKFPKVLMKFDVRIIIFESNYHEKVHLKHMKIMIFLLKFIIFDQFRNKNNKF